VPKIARQSKINPAQDSQNNLQKLSLQVKQAPKIREANKRAKKIVNQD